MKKQLELVRQFHEKFHVPILEKPSLIPSDRTNLRYKLIKDEVEEYREGVGQEDLENIALELADILYATLGTVLEHGLQNKIIAVFEEVHRSNMSKEYSQYKMVKGEYFRKADVSGIL